jgi:hypothetical protein
MAAPWLWLRAHIAWRGNGGRRLCRFVAMRDTLAATRDELCALLTTPRTSHPKNAGPRAQPHRRARLRTVRLDGAKI